MTDEADFSLKTHLEALCAELGEGWGWKPHPDAENCAELKSPEGIGFNVFRNSYKGRVAVSMKTPWDNGRPQTMFDWLGSNRFEDLTRAEWPDHSKIKIAARRVTARLDDCRECLRLIGEKQDKRNAAREDMRQALNQLRAAGFYADFTDQTREVEARISMVDLDVDFMLLGTACIHSNTLAISASVPKRHAVRFLTMLANLKAEVEAEDRK